MQEAEARGVFMRALESFRARDFSTAIQLWGDLQQEGIALHNQDLYLAVARREQARVLQLVEDFGAELDRGVSEEACERLASGDYAGAARLLEDELTGGDGVEGLVRLSLAQVELIRGHFQDALFHLEQVRLLGHESARLFSSFGTALKELGRPLEAEREFRRAVALDAGYVAAWYGLARLYFEDERYEMAESCLQRVLLTRPGSLHATTLMDRVRRHQDQTPRLIDEAREILEAHPDYPDWHHRIAVYYSFSGEYEKAREHLRAALEINPRLAKSAYQLGMLEAQTGQYPEACEAFEACLEAQGLEASPEVEAARRMRSEGREEEAAYEYSVAVSPPEERAGRHIELGKRLFAENFLPQARRELERAIALQPGYPDAHYVLGRIAAGEGARGQARACFKKALELSPYYQAAALGLAREELLAGNVGACRELYAQYGADPRPDLELGWLEVRDGLEKAGG